MYFILIHQFSKAGPGIILCRHVSEPGARVFTIFSPFPILSFRLLPWLQSDLLRINLNSVRCPRRLRFQVSVMLHLLFIKRFLMIIMLSFLLYFLVCTNRYNRRSKGQFLTTRCECAKWFLPILTKLIRPLRTIGNTRTQGLMPLVLAVRRWRGNIRAIMLPPKGIAQPLRYPLNGPQLVPILISTFSFLSRRLNGRIRHLILTTQPLHVSLSVANRSYC